MKAENFKPIFRKLAIAYGSRLDDDAETMLVYFDILKDLPTELVQAAALEYLASDTAFPPAPGQIRARAVRLTKRSNKVPSAAEAWQEVLEAPADGLVRWSEQREDGWHIYTQPYEWQSAITEKVARNLGWPSRFWTDNLTSDRARFMNAYEQQLDISTEEMTSLPEVQRYIEAGQSDIKAITDGFRRAALERGE